MKKIVFIVSVMFTVIIGVPVVARAYDMTVDDRTQYDIANQLRNNRMGYCVEVYEDGKLKNVYDIDYYNLCFYRNGTVSWDRYASTDESVIGLVKGMNANGGTQYALVYDSSIWTDTSWNIIRFNYHSTTYNADLCAQTSASNILGVASSATQPLNASGTAFNANTMPTLSYFDLPTSSYSFVGTDGKHVEYKVKFAYCTYKIFNSYTDLVAYMQSGKTIINYTYLDNTYPAGLDLDDQHNFETQRYYGNCSREEYDSINSATTQYVQYRGIINEIGQTDAIHNNKQWKFVGKDPVYLYWYQAGTGEKSLFAKSKTEFTWYYYDEIKQAYYRGVGKSCLLDDTTYLDSYIYYDNKYQYVKQLFTTNMQYYETEDEVDAVILMGELPDHSNSGTTSIIGLNSAYSYLDNNAGSLLSLIYPTSVSYVQDMSYRSMLTTRWTYPDAYSAYVPFLDYEIRYGVQESDMAVNGDGYKILRKSVVTYALANNGDSKVSNCSVVEQIANIQSVYDTIWKGSVTNYETTWWSKFSGDLVAQDPEHFSMLVFVSMRFKYTDTNGKTYYSKWFVKACDGNTTYTNDLNNVVIPEVASSTATQYFNDEQDILDHGSGIVAGSDSSYYESGAWLDNVDSMNKTLPGILNSVLASIRSLLAMVGAVPVLFTSIMTFLPAEVIGLFTVSMVLCIVVGIVRQFTK